MRNTAAESTLDRAYQIAIRNLKRQKDEARVKALTDELASIKAETVTPQAIATNSGAAKPKATARGHIQFIRSLGSYAVKGSREEVKSTDLASKKHLLVYFSASWCGPCKVIAPILGEIAEEYAGKLQVAKLNIDENPATPPKYGIRGIPTLMLFKGGNVEATKVGALSKSQLSAFLDSNL